MKKLLNNINLDLVIEIIVHILNGCMAAFIFAGQSIIIGFVCGFILSYLLFRLLA